MRLYDVHIRNRTRPGKMGDGRGGRGLFVRFQWKQDGTLSSNFCQRLRIHGKVCEIGLGNYEDVSLKQARKKAKKNWKKAKKGKDPRVQRKVPTFRVVADQVIASRRAGWKDSRTENDWGSSLRIHAMDILGNKPVNKISSVDILAVLEPIWTDKPVQARRVLSRIRAVMKRSKARGWISNSPAGEEIEEILGVQGHTTENIRSQPHEKAGEAIMAVRGSTAWIMTKLSYEFLVRTAARTKEVRFAKWSQIDFENRVWTIPAEDMKAGREHRVPLSSGALDILNEAASLASGSEYVFPSQHGDRPMGQTTLVRLGDRLSIDGSPHGYRSTFRSWTSDNEIPWEQGETALAHKIPGMAGPYMRSDLLELRRTVMQDYIDYIDAQIRSLEAEESSEDS